MNDKIIEVFIDNIGVQVESVNNYGSTSIQKLSDLQLGAGSTAMKADKSGLWLGADKYVDAPFKVDMLGNLFASSASFPSFITIHVFKQDAIPTSTSVGDLWFDTNDSNKIYRSGVAGASTIASGQWELLNDLRAADAILKAGSGQTLSGDIQVGSALVKIDGANGRIIINDGTYDRILIGYQSGGF